MKPDIKTMLIILLIVMVTAQFQNLPWWTFTIPVLVLGIITKESFMTGFIPGFSVWSGVNTYFDLRLHSGVLSRLGQFISLPEIAVILIAGLIGGLLSGLALYTGKSLSAKEKAPDVNSPITL